MRHTAFFDERTNDHAIYNAYRIVEAIRLWGRDYQARNAYEGQPACIHVGSIQGGWPWRISRTPFSCAMYVDIRINPKQRPEAVLQELKTVVWSAFPEGRETRRIEIEPYVIVPSVVARGDELVFDAIKAAHQNVFGQPPALEFRGPMADSVHMNAAGIPTVTYGIGPGGNFDAVNPNTGEVGEQIRIADYVKLIGIYLDAAQRVCGRRG
jgi:acetylornithine deacetylase